MICIIGFIFVVFLLIKRRAERSIRFSSHISTIAIWSFLIFIIFYIGYSIHGLSKMNVVSITDKVFLDKVVLFLVNLATMLGLYHILDENRKKTQPKKEEEKREIIKLNNTIRLLKEEEKREIVKLKSTIRLLKEEINTNKQQKFYEDYYRKTDNGK